MYDAELIGEDIHIIHNVDNLVDIEEESLESLPDEYDENGLRLIKNKPFIDPSKL